MYVHDVDVYPRKWGGKRQNDFYGYMAESVGCLKANHKFEKRKSVLHSVDNEMHHNEHLLILMVNWKEKCISHFFPALL